MRSGQHSFVFTLADKEFSAYAQQGEVVEIQSHSETHISGTGGGGSISTNAAWGYSDTSGKMSNINISSTVHNMTKLWVKTPKGLEEEWIFPVDITQLSVRKGHNVCLYSIEESKTRKSSTRKFINVTTKKGTNISTPEETLKIFNLAHDESIKGYAFGGAALGVIPAMIIGNKFGFGGGIMAFIGTIVIFLAIGVGAQYKNSGINFTYTKSLEDVDTKMIDLIFSDTHIKSAT